MENWGFLTRRSWPGVDGLAQHLNYTLDRPELSEPKLLKEWQQPWRVFNNVYLISELSELSELDEDTFTIENNVRKELSKATKKSKTASNKSKAKKTTTKAKTMAKETTRDSDVDTGSSTDTEVESAEETDDKIQTPTRKRPSDYIAKKDRPENLKSDQKINQLSLDEAIEICKLSAKRA